jgi:hypothetical protein
MTNNLLRQENESFFEWKVRLIALKIDKEIDLDWIEIRDLLELDCSQTTYGKLHMDYMNTINLLSNKKLFKPLLSLLTNSKKRKKKWKLLRFSFRIKGVNIGNIYGMKVDLITSLKSY